MEQQLGKVIIGLSGGVDSSVAAHLLIEQGYQVEGLFMKNWEEDDTDSYCSASLDLADAQSVCDKLNIPLHTVNFSSEYWDNVFSHFLAEYRAGRTPNPDILCNREIKFKAFFDYAKHLGADYIATGHYVKKVTEEGVSYLKKAFDKNKDQSYFLHAVSQLPLQHSLFPLGDIDKPQVRLLAKELGFENASKKDSTGICFIGERRFKHFLSQYLPAQPGKIIDTLGKVIGQHDGLMYYTLGQRQGLGIGGLKDASNDPWYVIEKKLETNELIVAQGDHPLLYTQSLVTKDVHWISLRPSKNQSATFTCFAKTRYRQPDQACEVTQLENGNYHVRFIEKQRAVTPGQSVVFYQEDTCLGGGVITETFA